MREEIKSQMTRPEEGERGSGVSHRRGGIGWDSYRRPPEDRRSEGLVKALDRVESPTSKAPGAKRKVESMRDKRAKRTASGKLHIDNGCMGGGGSIGYHKYITFGQTDPKHPDYVDFYDDYKDNGYFDASRKGIFHYCIFSNKLWYNYTGSFTNYAGVGNTPGDDFIVSSDQSEYTFMHELGHNLNLHHPINKDGSYYYSDYSSVGGAKKTVMYTPSADATGGMTYDKLWKYIELDYI